MLGVVASVAASGLLARHLTRAFELELFDFYKFAE